MRIPSIALCAVVLLASAAYPALAQDKSFKESIIGAWLVTSVADVGENGQSSDRWKGQTTGQITLGRTGRFTQILVGPAVASMESDDPRKPDRLIVAHYGTYTYDAANKVINFKIEGSTYPNWTGTEQKRTIISFAGDDLKWSVAASIGGMGEVGWKRAK